MFANKGLIRDMCSLNILYKSEERGGSVCVCVCGGIYIIAIAIAATAKFKHGFPTAEVDTFALLLAGG